MNLSKYKTSTILIAISFAILLLANTIFILTTYYFFKKEAFEEARQKANLILDKNLSVHDYFTNNLKPHLFEILTDTIKNGEYFEPVWMSSTYAIGELDNYFLKRNSFGYYYKDASFNARNKKNEADSFELQFLKQLNNNPVSTEKEGLMDIDGKPYYYVLKKGETLDKNCLQCHSLPENAPKKLVKIYGNKKSFNRQEGEIISVVSLRIPVNTAYIRAHHYIIIISLITTFFVFLILMMYIFIQKRLIFNPIDVLRNQSAAIANDKTRLGETIKLNTTKDLTDFVNSFNLMSERLADYQNILEEKIKEKTIALENKIEEISQLNKAKEQIYSIIGHDLKAPFSSIIGFSDLLAKNVRKYDIDKIEDFNKIINRTVRHSYNLLEDLLLWSKSQTGKLSFEPRGINFGELCHKIVDQLIHLAQAKQILIELSETTNIQVYADINLLQTILRNLISNAIKFTNENGLIKIYAVKDGDYAVIVVSDNGTGIENDLLDDFWNLSDKLRKKGTLGEKGGGLGLVLCKEFVEKHKGKIWVESEYGKGSDFKFTIPLIKS